MLKCASDQTPTPLPWGELVNGIYQTMTCVLFSSFGEVGGEHFSFLFIGYLLEAVVAASDSGSLADLAKILSELSGGDNCVFRCPKGKLTYSPID